MEHAKIGKLKKNPKSAKEQNKSQKALYFWMAGKRKEKSAPFCKKTLWQSYEKTTYSLPPLSTFNPSKNSNPTSYDFLPKTCRKNPKIAEYFSNDPIYIMG
jgi:hypothetical protein